ncbi:hypothetical protein BVY03_04065 [bacterium K02(2017)]|nr:hypothetical protein BVY03_04065 [bacterium K02(2017)]
MTLINITLEILNQVATVSINRPKALNALNQDVLKELRQIFNDFKNNTTEVKAVILTGSGEKAFVAGADITAMQNLSALEAQNFCSLGHETMRLIETCAVPVIAAVNGFCLGGGFELALSCDYIYASKEAKLGLPEVNLGLFPGFGGTQRLARLIGKNRAKELIYTAAMLSADEAYNLGIVNKVFDADQLINETQKNVATILKKGPVAIRMAKQVINQGTDLPLASGLNLEETQFPIIFATQDSQEGIAAFLEKRKAEFKNT